MEDSWSQDLAMAVQPWSLQGLQADIREDVCVWTMDGVPHKVRKHVSATRRSECSPDWCDTNHNKTRDTRGGSPASERQSKMIFMGHQISSCQVPVVRSFFILWKMLLSSLNLPYDHLPKYTNITFQYPKKWPCFVQKFISWCPNINFSCPKKSHCYVP